MKIIIASSKSWFGISNYLKNNHQISLITNKNELTLENIKKLIQTLYFFLIGVGKFQLKFMRNINVFYFIQHLYHLEEEEVPYKILYYLDIKNLLCALKMVEELDSGPILLKGNIT